MKAFTTCFLSACSIIFGPQFSGESTTGNVLRDDVIAQIRKAEIAIYHCRDITAVQSNINDVQKINGRILAKENWTVTACDKQHIYPITLREDEYGETDFFIRL